MDKITTVGILFGGQSAEHDVSLKSTQALLTNLDREKYTPQLIYISREDGFWHLISEDDFNGLNFQNIPGYSFLPWLNNASPSLDADIYFPMLHGPNGEDGKIQALLELAGKPYVGANFTASDLAMDKVVAKMLFQHAGLNVVEYLYYVENNIEKIQQETADILGYPVFVKPSAMGSSVGITKASTPDELEKAVTNAFRYDRKILIEKAMNIREIEISVMGNREIMVSQPGELIPHNDFYDYEDKYLEGKTTFHMPAQLDPDMAEKLRETAAKAYKTLFLNGMSRVDLFLEKQTNEIFVNEINTIPGFTEISMFPKLWSLQGITFKDLISMLIEFGFQYHGQHKTDVKRK